MLQHNQRVACLKLLGREPQVETAQQIEEDATTRALARGGQLTLVGALNRRTAPRRNRVEKDDGMEL